MESKYWVFGLQRSGTNFIEQAIETANPKLKNGSRLAIRPFNPVWKHSIQPPAQVGAKEPVIIVYKSIWNWIDSIVNRQVMDYLKTQTTYKIEEGDWILESESIAVRTPKLHKFSINQLAKTYKLFYDNWIKLLDTHNVVLVRYEDLLTEDRDKIAKRIGQRLGIKAPKFKTKKPAKYTQSFDKSRQEMYLQGVHSPHADQLEYQHIVHQYIQPEWIQELDRKRIQPEH